MPLDTVEDFAIRICGVPTGWTILVRTGSRATGRPAHAIAWRPHWPLNGRPVCSNGHAPCIVPTGPHEYQRPFHQRSPLSRPGPSFKRPMAATAMAWRACGRADFRAKQNPASLSVRRRLRMHVLHGVQRHAAVHKLSRAHWGGTCKLFVASFRSSTGQFISYVRVSANSFVLARCTSQSFNCSRSRLVRATPNTTTCLTGSIRGSQGVRIACREKWTAKIRRRSKSRSRDHNHQNATGLQPPITCVPGTSTPFGRLRFHPPRNRTAISKSSENDSTDGMNIKAVALNHMVEDRTASSAERQSSSIACRTDLAPELIVRHCCPSARSRIENVL